MRNKIKLILMAAVIISISPFAGTSGHIHAELFPGVTGQALCDSLVKYYKSSPYLGYDSARDTLYGVIDNVSDYLTCVYSGYSIYMQPGQDPSSWAYSHDINCEHTWPQSMGADQGSQPGYDMHHMFPTEVDVNSARGNLPFGEIPDAQTDKWFRNNSYITSIPTSNIDEYSELLTNVKFEVREDHCGNTARAMFYFFTMWRSYYLAEDPDTSFFNYQKYDLLDWHRQDPPDQREIDRTYAIAGYQGKVNPFVIDSTLVMRCYFPDLLGIENRKTDIHSGFAFSMETGIIDVYYNTYLTVTDRTGRKVFAKSFAKAGTADVSFLPAGIYFILLSNGTEKSSGKITVLK